jgi:16S rRNA C967 or C1407 C5-methylase (RsmB/RsmF family)
MQKHSAVTAPNGIIFDDFFSFFTKDVTSALLDAICGTGLIQRNPAFPKNFLDAL